MLACSRTVLNSQSTLPQILFAEPCVSRAQDRRRAQIAHPDRRARSNGCPPSALLLEAAFAGDVGTKFLVGARPIQVRSQREKSLSGWCHRSPCDRAVESEPS